MGQLGNWVDRIEINIDNTNIGSDLTHFPVTIPLGASVGQSNQDLSDIFDKLTYPHRPEIGDATFTGEDDFEGHDGAMPNVKVWIATNGNPSIQSNKLYIDKTAADAEIIESLFRVSGDFSVEVLYSDFSYVSGDTYIFLKWVADDDGYSMKINRNRGSSSNYYYTERRLAGTATTQNIVASTATSGGFRIVRSGTTVTTYYYTTSWVQSHQYTSSGFSGDGELSLGVTGGTGICTVNLDDFIINSGTIAWPEMEDRFIGDDDDDPNAYIWSKYHDDQDSGDSSGTQDIQSDKLAFSLSAVTLPVTQSVYTISGNFDIQVDFDAAIPSPNAEWAYGLGIGSGNTSIFADPKWAYIARYDLTYGPYRSGTYNVSSSTAGSADIFGKFRIVRTGNSLVTYYWGGSSWTTHTTDASYGSDDVVVKLFTRVWGASPTTLSGTFDNFVVNSGTIVWNEIEDFFTGTDGDAADTDLWTTLNQTANTLCNIQSNKLEFDITSEAATPYCKSKFYLSGDFDFQVDFDLVVAGVTNIWLLGFFLNKVSDDSNYGGIDIRYDSGKEYLASSYDGGTLDDSVVTSDTSGKLRAVRSGTTINFYYWGGSSWTLLHTRTVTDVDIYIRLRTTTTTVQSFNGTFDNFVVNSGTIVWPENTHPNRKKIAITKDDGTTQLYGELEHWDSENIKAVIHSSNSDFVISSSAVTDLYFYYDPTQPDNTIYINDTGETTALVETGDIFTGTDGDLPNEDLWRVTDGTGTTTDIQSNALNFDTVSAASTGVVSSLFIFSGDFDIQFDFSLITAPSTSIWLIGCICHNYDGSFAASIDVRYVSGKYYQSYIDAYNGNSATSDTSGKLRMVRSGSTITTYYWNGSSWTQVQTYASSSIQDLTFTLRTTTTTSMSFEGAVDNFIINSGTPVYAPTYKVWQANYRLVYHMAQDPDGDVVGSILDSTGRKKHGTPYGSMTTADLVSGEIGKAIELDAVDDYIDIPTPELFHKTDSFTLFSVGYSAANIFLVYGAGLTGDTWSIAQAHNIAYGVAALTLATMDFTDPSYSVWNTFNLTRDGSDWNSWTNNGSKGNDTQSGDLRGLSGDYVAKVVLGCRWNSGVASSFLGGKIAEVRFSDVLRSDDWQEAEHYSIKDDLISFDVVIPTPPASYEIQPIIVILT